MYLAEGVLQQGGHGLNKYPSFSLHEDELDLVNNIRALFGEGRVKVYPKPGSRGIQVMAFVPSYGRLFEHLGGKGSATKQMHSRVWSLPRESRLALLSGYIAGDGGKVRAYQQIHTVSPHLAVQMRLLAESVGYTASLYRTEATPGGMGVGKRQFKTTRPIYQLQVYDSNRSKTHRKASRPTEVTHDGVTYLLRYVQSVDMVAYSGDVVNLSVEGSPTFQTAVGVSHNTVKPISLMAYLCRMITPPNGIIIDPFTGSGTTGMAAMLEGFDFIGIEREDEYVAIANARIQAAKDGAIAWDPKKPGKLKIKQPPQPQVQDDDAA